MLDEPCDTGDEPCHSLIQIGVAEFGNQWGYLSKSWCSGGAGLLSRI